MPPTAADQTAEQNKALVRQIVEDIDRAPGAEAIARWLAPDFTTVVNNDPPMSREAYLEMAAGITTAFSNIRHEVLDVVAEGDRVAVAMTLHLTHTGDYEGIAATGRSVSVPEMSMMVIRDGLIASERVLIDLAGLHQQLTAAA